LTAKGDISVTIMTREYPPDVYGGAGVHVDYLSHALARLMPVEVRRFGSHHAASESGPAVVGYDPWPELARGSDARVRKVLDPLSVNLAMVRDPIGTEVVHCHTWYTFFAGHLAKMMYGVKLITTIHSLEPLRPWKREQLGRGYEVSSWMERAGVESSDAVIAVSQAMRDDIISHYNVDPARVVVIHNGIDLAAYRRVEDRKALDARGIRQPYVLFVGRVSRQKGITYLLEAAESFPEGVTLVLCASSPDTPELQEEVVQKVSRMRNVVWIDRMLPKSELVQLYSHASVFVCPSVYEPFGIINLEAMACETAVVATAVGGIPEVVEDGITGILVEPGNPVDLARAVTGILESPDVARRMGEAGRARVEERFSWQAIAKQTKRLYEEIAAS